MIASAREPFEIDSTASYDRQLQSATLELLSRSKYGALRCLRCEVLNGVVEISGTVSTFYLKQLAQQAVMQSHPSATVRNLVQVTGENPVSMAKTCAPQQASV